MEGWTVRRVTAADAARMRALRLEMLADTPLAYLESLAEAASRSHEKYRARVAEAARGPQLSQFIAGPPTGGALTGHAGGIQLPEEPDVTVVFAVYVTPARRGGKMLAELIGAVTDWSRAAGRRKLMLEVLQSNHRAIRAYEKLGFEDSGERLPHPVWPALTELRMRRSI